MNKKKFDIRNCDLCHSGIYTPFFFPIKNQEVMVITAAPSMQAMYKPLTSIRFFRKLCFALFGDKYLREKNLCDRYLLEFCEGNIYWTHYYKCYSPGLTDFSQISDICANKYLRTEIELLKPKLIIVFGDDIREKIRTLIGNRSCRCIFKPFPDTGDEEIFNEVRDKLKPFLKCVKKTGFAFRSTYNLQDNDLQGNEVHLRFEFNAFEKMFNEQELEIPTTTVEDLWHRNLVVPNMKRYTKLVSAFAFIENQIKVFLLDYMARTKNYTVFKEMRRSYSEPTWKDVFIHIKKEAVDFLLDDFLEYKSVKFKSRKQPIIEDLRELRKIRNQIVHEGGFISPKKIGSQKEIIDNCLYHSSNTELIPGVFIFANTIFISQEGERNILKLVKEVVELLCKMQF